MLRFKNFLLFENPQNIYDKYFNDMEWVDYVKLVSLDPTSKSKKGDIKKVGKYVKFMKKWYTTMIVWYKKDLELFKKRLSIYHSLTNRGKTYNIKPIDTFGSFDAFDAYIKDLENLYLQLKNTLEKQKL